MYGYIYQTTDNLNNKIYIGKHVKKYFDKKYYGSGRLLKQAIEKYGIDCFTCKLIDTASNEMELREKEIFHINDRKSYDMNIGYNISFGGHSRKHNPIPSLDKPKERMFYLCTKKHLCDTFQLSIKKIDRLMKNGLPFVKLERAVRFDPVEVESWLKDGGKSNADRRIDSADNSN